MTLLAALMRLVLTMRWPHPLDITDELERIP